jgi:hypothetical protein
MRSKNIVEDFISFHKLRRDDNSIIFNAQVSFYHDQVLHKLPSSIQIITLPKALVLYIDEFFFEGYQQPEVYSTENFYFSSPGPGVLEIRGFESQPDFLISIMLVG